MGHLQEEMDNYDMGGAQESIWVFLAVSHSTGDMEPEEVVSCGQEGIQMY